MSDDALHIEYIALNTALLWDSNKKRHDIGALIQSFQKHGFKDAPKFEPSLNGGKGGIVEGNGRFMALDAMRRQGDAPPRGIAESDGQWLVPVTFGVDAASEAAAQAYGIDHNALTLSGGDFALGDHMRMWEAGFLDDLQELAEVDELPVFLDGEDLDALLAAEAGIGDGGDTAPQIDKADELREKWGTELGQVWSIGKHLLYCGDSQGDIGVLGELPKNLFYDPPWDMELPRPSGFDAVLAFCDGGRANQTIEMFGAPDWIFTWDCQASIFTNWNRPLRRVKYAMYFGDIALFDLNGAFWGEPNKPSVKVSNFTDEKYFYNPDPRGKHLSDLFAMSLAQLHSGGGHHHEKPLDWVRLLIGDCFTGDVYDPFAGSGTSFVACQQLGRRCFGVEIEPGYVALILQRLHDLGLNPHLERTP